jgi:hypothetical protein
MMIANWSCCLANNTKAMMIAKFAISVRQSTQIKHHPGFFDLTRLRHLAIDYPAFPRSANLWA